MGATPTIPFNRPPLLGDEAGYITQALAKRELSGGKSFSRKCEQWFEEKLNAPRAIITPSCTAALEMAAILIDCQPGDEIIMPSFTFVSTANAFALRGAKIIFADVDPATMNVSAASVAAAITGKTKAIVVVHYGGVGCEMEEIGALAKARNLFLIEDAAQAIMADYADKPLGSFGHLSCFSFHETKNVVCGEGGMLVINAPQFVSRAEIIQEKGTNRKQFIAGLADKYTWVDIGSSYLPGEMQAAYLYAQLGHAAEITDARMAAWHYYDAKIRPLAEKGLVETQRVPQNRKPNGHLFYIKLKNRAQRDGFILFARERGVQTAFHYIPLHSSPAGKKYGAFAGEDRYTTADSERLVRLPMFFDLTRAEQDKVVAVLDEFLKATA
ncbi:MAG: dTDP-4-amino-4,6-dideoxygalactose transaminase [Alphaproteobacteria bacterium]